jgi:hypothetical protein
MAEDKVLKELELGIRELFRILVPGAYAVTLAKVAAPTSAFTTLVTGSTASGIAASFFLGLIGYALRPHERWFPFYMHFEKYRHELNSAIASVLGKDVTSDNVDIYKYFLETQADDMSDRIHYFSSFYYMLIELALFSWVAAFFVLCNNVWRLTAPAHPNVTRIAVALVICSGLLQFAIQWPLTAVKTKRTENILKLEWILSSLALVIFVEPACRASTWSLSGTMHMGAVPVALFAVGYLFWRLGDKHWKQIIREQVVLVNHRAATIVEIAKEHK